MAGSPNVENKMSNKQRRGDFESQKKLRKCCADGDAVAGIEHDDVDEHADGDAVLDEPEMQWRRSCQR